LAHNVNTVRKRSVALLGDSITWGSRLALMSALKGASTPIGEITSVGGAARPGIRLTSPGFIDDAEAVARKAGYVILNIGTNDAWAITEPAVSSEAFQEAHQDLLGRINSPVVVVTLTTRSFNTERNALCASYNSYLRGLGLGVVDWQKAISDHVDAGSPGGSYTTDTVHPSPLGAAVLSALYLSAIESMEV
jgi:lysophospholipase L1-like esterase